MKYFLLAFPFILLSACGGGGGGGGDVISTNTTPDSSSNQNNSIENSSPDSSSNQGNTLNIIVSKFDNSLFGTSEFAAELESTFFDNSQFQ